MRKSSRPGLSGRLRSPAFVALVILVIQSVSAPNPSHELSPAVRPAIPIDADAPQVWSEAIAGAPTVGMVILNPANGPGEGVKATYARLVGEAQAEGISVLGYVYTQWANGNVSVQQAEGWIDRYYAWYHVDGIMLDEANDTCYAAPLNFYSALYDYVKSKPGPAIVLLNPGTATGQCYVSISDVLLTFENDYASYTSDYVGSNWTAGFPPSRFFHIVFDVPTVADMQNVVSTAAARGAGWVYVTNLNNSKGNPYSSLPYYFAQELAYVRQLDHPMQATPFATPMLLILGLAAAGSVMVVLGGRKTVDGYDS